jgi:hypothetical protein
MRATDHSAARTRSARHLHGRAVVDDDEIVVLAAACLRARSPVLVSSPVVDSCRGVKPKPNRPARIYIWRIAGRQRNGALV